MKEFFNRFKIYDYNRDVVPKSVIKIKNSIITNGYLPEERILVTPITNEVSPGFHIILDGQHRYTACVELNVAFTYTIVNEATTKEEIEKRIKIYNVDRLNLKSQDYVKLNKENSNYKILDKLVIETNFSISSILRMTDRNNVGAITATFKNGEFEISNEQYDEVLKVYKLNKIINNNNNIKKSNDVFSVPLSRVISDSNVQINILESKLEKFSRLLNKGTMIQNIIGLYNIYNHASRERDRILIPEKYTKKIK